MFTPRITAQKILTFFKYNWGSFIFYFSSLFAFNRLQYDSTFGHYQVFTRAAQALWNQQTAYGTDFGTHVGPWFYSPSCGLFFFSGFSLLPERLGMSVYVLLSLTLFVLGSLKLLKTLIAQNSFASATQVYFCGVAAVVYSPILATKLELAMVGILFYAVAPLFQKHISTSTQIKTGLLLALILNWKFQPLPTLGLLASVLILRKSHRLWLMVCAIATAALYALPWAILPAAYLKTQHQLWSSSLSAFIRNAFLGFDNLFSFLHVHGVTLTHVQSQIVSIFIALSFLVLTLLNARNTRQGLLTALALGATFTCALSPLHQNNAYVLCAPLFVAWLALYFENDHRTVQKQVWKYTISTAALLWLCIGLLYSDLVPEGVSSMARSHHLKPLFVIILGYLFSIFLKIISSGQKPVKLDCKRFTPTNAVKPNQFTE